MTRIDTYSPTDGGQALALLKAIERHPKTGAEVVSASITFFAATPEAARKAAEEFLAHEQGKEQARERAKERRKRRDQ